MASPTGPDRLLSPPSRSASVPISRYSRNHRASLLQSANQLEKTTPRSNLGSNLNLDGQLDAQALTFRRCASTPVSWLEITRTRTQTLALALALSPSPNP